jgi:hypothetical protein
MNYIGKDLMAYSERTHRELTPAPNRRLAQSRVSWLIEHSTSLQFLFCFDSFVLQNPPLCQAPKHYGNYRKHLCIILTMLQTF